MMEMIGREVLMAAECQGERSVRQVVRSRGFVRTEQQFKQ
jgi:hypothetical protein